METIQLGNCFMRVRLVDKIHKPITKAISCSHVSDDLVFVDLSTKQIIYDHDAPTMMQGCFFPDSQGKVVKTGKKWVVGISKLCSIIDHQQ